MLLVGDGNVDGVALPVVVVFVLRVSLHKFKYFLKLIIANITNITSLYSKFSFEKAVV